MFWFLVWCLVSATPTEIGAVTVSMPPAESCTCQCQCEVDCTTTTTCAPTSKCDNLDDPSSDFSTNCAPLLNPAIVAQMKKDCRKAELAGPEAVDNLCENIKVVCAAKGADIVCDEVTCPTTTECPTTSLCDNLKPGADSQFMTECADQLSPRIVDQMYKDCLAREVDGPDAVADFCENVKLVCQAKGAEIDCPVVTCPTTTDCIPTSLCDNLKPGADSQFMTECADRLSPKIVDQMYKDCLAREDDGPDAVADFCENVKLVCQAKGAEIDCPVVTCPIDCDVDYDNCSCSCHCEGDPCPPDVC